MKAIFISYSQTLTDRVNRVIEQHNIRGFTKWELTHGRGSKTGEPHYGTHAWPSMNSSILTIVEAERVDKFLAALKALDEATPQHGLRAFVWDITESI